MSSPAQPTLSYISYEAFIADVQAIARALDTADWTPDFIVGIGRGGLVPGTFLSHRTGIAMLSVDHSSRVADFSDDLLVKLAAMSAAGRRILFVDDINDSGATLVYLRETILRNGGNSKNQRVAVLINNVRSKAAIDYSSRTIDRDVDKDWFVFPWESVAPKTALIDEALSVPERLA